MKRYLILAAIGMQCLIAGAQATRSLTADKTNDYGIVYSLPKTGLEITASATVTMTKAGPFYQYAAKFIGTDKVVREDGVKWTLGEVNLRPYGVADPEESYVMQLKPGASVSVNVAEDGMLLGINTQAEPPYQPTVFRPAPPKPDPKPIDEYLKYVDEDFLACQSTYKQAEMLASTLMEIREARIALTRGTAETMPTDGRQLELMLAGLQDQEDAIKRAFTGETVTETYSRNFLVLPNDEGETVVCRFSEFSGFVDADDLSGAPLSLTIKIVSEPELPVDVRGEVKKLPKDAVIYNIPASARVNCSYDGRKLVEREQQFGQFGITFGLAPTLFTDKKEPYSATFVPETGALSRVSPL